MTETYRYYFTMRSVTQGQPGAAPEHFNFAADVLDEWARSRGAALALWHVEAATGAETKLSFAQISSMSCQTANVLTACGIGPGDRVLVMLPRIPEWWLTMLALIRIGAVPVPATLLLTRRDVEFRINSARISAVITSEEGMEKVGDFSGIRVLAGEPRHGWFSLSGNSKSLRGHFKGPRTRSSDPGIIYFTSATTGEPKMVLHTQASYGLAHRQTGDLWLDLKPGDVHWNISDLGWGKAAWSSFFGPWHMGACVFAIDSRGKFDAATALDTLAHFPITTWCAPPTALRLVVRQDLNKWKFPSLRHCVTAGEPLNPEVLARWKEATGLTLYEGYGQTETVVLIGNFRQFGASVRPGSMGKANPHYELVLLDEALRPVGPGVEGEIAIRVSRNRPLGLFQEYWGNPAENAQKFRGEWYLTGDKAFRDQDGYYWFVGRKDDVIKSSGYRIGPFEVESALLEHSAVLDVAVVGKPDPLRGQIVKAYVVLRPGHTGTEELKVELQAHCKKLVAAYKYPREVEFLSELPKTTSGKTRHVQLRTQCGQRGLQLSDAAEGK